MKFIAHVTETTKEYIKWQNLIQNDPKSLVMRDFADYRELAKPTEFVPVTYYSHVPDDLFAKVVKNTKAH